MAYLFQNMELSRGTEWIFTHCRENGVLLMVNNVRATIAVEHMNKEKPRAVTVKPFSFYQKPNAEFHFAKRFIAMKWP